MQKQIKRWFSIVLAVAIILNTVIPVYAENGASVSENDIEMTLAIEEVREEIADAEYVEGEILIVTNDQEMQVVELDEDEDIAEAIVEYEEQPEILFAQPNYIYYVETYDPYYAHQTENYLDVISAEKAWDLAAGKPMSDILVAVIDTGAQADHPDLAANIDLARSKNLMDATGTLPITDAKTHGTHVTGTIAAIANNGIGIAGIGYNHAKIAVIRCTDSNSFNTDDLVTAIDYAISIGARIINMSLGGFSLSDNALELALQRAYNAGTIVICSAGNYDGTHGKTETHYPSCYPTTLGIISTDSAGNLSYNSNYNESNFISAPGENIMSTLPGSKYGTSSGTSMATAVVSGCAAFLLSLNPNLTQQQLTDLMASTATDTYTRGFDAYSGYGVINLEAATAKLLDDKLSSVRIPDEVKSPTSVENFVKRLYYYCLDREPDTAGFNDWVSQLKKRQKNGGEVACGFFFSKEFQARKLTDSEYVTLLYRVFLGREPDPAGKANWMNHLSNGMTRLYVMNGFSTSAEFTRICNACGFSMGTVKTQEARDVNPGTTAFVSRLYTKALGRSYDIGGLNDWCNWINSKQMTALDVATNGFFHSREFRDKRTSDSEFVKILYRTFLDREYDQAGYNDWMKRLRSGYSRDQVIAGFANSKEFKEIMARYGL